MLTFTLGRITTAIHIDMSETKAAEQKQPYLCIYIYYLYIIYIYIIYIIYILYYVYIYYIMYIYYLYMV